MKLANIYISLLLCCFCFQTNALFIEYVISLNKNESISLSFKKISGDSKSNEKESDNESEENENKEENKKKEFNEFYYLKCIDNSLNFTIRLYMNSCGCAKIFKRFFEIEIPPPKTFKLISI